MIKSEKKREEMFTLTKVKELGFTDKLIKTILPEPILATNPVYKSAAMMKLWMAEDVKKAMENHAFQEVQKKRELRQAAAQKAVVTKKKKLEEMMNQFRRSIVVEKIPLKEIRKQTLEEKRKWYDIQSFYRGTVQIQNVYDADDNTILRWMVNYIRHNMTTYDEVLFHIKGKTGCHEVYSEFVILVLRKIAEVYPELQSECERQIRAKNSLEKEGEGALTEDMYKETPASLAK